jgi:CBS domain-containing protein
VRLCDDAILAENSAQEVIEMDVRDVMTREVVTVGPGTSLKEVARLLVEKRISGVPVVDDGGELLGIVSEADYVTKEVAASSGVVAPRHHFLRGDDKTDVARIARGRATTAGEAMSSPPITVEPWASVADAARVMDGKRVNRLPVVDAGQMVGIVTRADIVRAFTRDDTQVERDVHDALRAVDGVVISVHDGFVSLAGTVSHETIVPTLTALTASIPGVTSVDGSKLSWREPLS